MADIQKLSLRKIAEYNRTIIRSFAFNCGWAILESPKIREWFNKLIGQHRDSGGGVVLSAPSTTIFGDDVVKENIIYEQ